MRAPSDLFGSALISRTGYERAAAIRKLRECGHRIDPSLRGRSRVLGLYTSPDGTRGALLRRLPSTGRVSTTRYGALKAAEIAFLHALSERVG